MIIGFHDTLLRRDSPQAFAQRNGIVTLKHIGFITPTTVLLTTLVDTLLAVAKSCKSEQKTNASRSTSDQDSNSNRRLSTLPHWFNFFSKTNQVTTVGALTAAVGA